MIQDINITIPKTKSKDNIELILNLKINTDNKINPNEECTAYKG